MNKDRVRVVALTVVGIAVGAVVCLYLLMWGLYGYTSSRHASNYFSYVAVVALPVASVVAYVRTDSPWVRAFVQGFLTGPFGMLALNQALYALSITPALQGWG